MIRSVIVACVAALTLSAIAAPASAVGGSYWFQRVVNGSPTNSCLVYYPGQTYPVNTVAPCEDLGSLAVWHRDKLDNGRTHWINGGSGGLLEVDPGEVGANGARARVHSVRTPATTAQEWTFPDAGNGFVYLVNQANSRYLSHDQSWTSLKNRGGNFQAWRMVPLP